ncbi:RdgB/HAM1 family non-canonical purine NTP pyrophosphatase [Arcobacter sp.]|uniref:RdgB/HAM1 family non-canonical purine NTP pyrophosphatase n=1 Tax=Arcobacter sp. TaxID=1872629 RepID=UPI003D14016C
MKIVLATSNKGKISEFKKLLPNEEIYTFKELIGDMEIIEDANSFKGNAIIKAKAIYEKLNNEDYIVVSDDSGITVPALNNEPGIYSARYAGEGSSDKENNAKLISKLLEKNLQITPAYYTACICIIYKGEVYTVHGWMYGSVISKEIGNEGFGYDPMFIPKGFDKTLGELNHEIKKEFSHRSKALKLAKKVLEVVLS